MNSLPQQIILASRNKHKIEELQALLSPLGIEVLSALDVPELPDVVEDGETFADNAIKKAVEIANQTGIYALADDSGLVVSALDGAPGVYSARYAGEGAGDEANNRKLLDMMKDIPAEERGAYFFSVLAFAEPQGAVKTFEGRCAGFILDKPRGQYGFGYDPLFYLPEYDQSMAEISPEEKNRTSHRARAYAQFVDWLQSKR